MPTPSMEDYIEQIYLLIKTKGYARVSSIAEILGVQPSSVTKMVQKLDQEGYLIYEKYRGIILTPFGQKTGKHLLYRHELLESLFHIIGVEEDNIYEEVEGIEHHLSPKTLDRIIDLVQFFQEDEQRIRDLQEIQRKNNSEQ
ncbi:transcriptional regulator MntR [Halobacillus amylolyticus]|uniref:Manganese transport regulator n=1 Tax=Halobacillus amylolyticus TaxID=2932259 RepID=A0ABY4HIB3_9BACI|nr:transcriptional regulator MntR [Halobacillus amylolyticus]UOR14143.1 transcriptional regulator MntR [Halobacillus amylolyticus]